MRDDIEKLLSHVEDIIHGKGLIKADLPPSFVNDPEILSRLLKIEKHVTDKVIDFDWAESKIDELNNTLLSYAQHDYTTQISNIENDLFNSLAVSVNFLGEELNYSTVTKHYLEDIFNSMEDILIAVDYKGTIVSCNKSLYNILKYNEENVIGENISTLTSNKNILQEIITNKIPKLETEFISKYNKPVPVSLRISSFVRGDNHAIGYIIIARDVSKFIEFQDKIEKLDFQLLSHIEKLEKTNIELQESIEKAKESDVLKSAFLANMSHEIRTPMNAILGFSELLVENDDLSTEAKYDYFDIINENSKALLRLIEDIIDFSKIEANQIKIIKKYFDLHEILDSLNLYYQNYIIKQNKNIEIRVFKEVEESQFIIFSDIIRIKQIISNLVDNAIKFTSSGYVEFGYKLINNSTVELFVKDTGIGIPTEKKEFIFDRFTKIEDNKDFLYRGTGLGLAITQKLVTLLDGEINVSSELDVGTYFSIVLPMKISNVVVNKPKAITVPDHNIKADTTILVVEDEHANQFLIIEILKQHNINILLATNGEDAIEICKNNLNIDLVLMDIKLPKIDGYEATKNIKSFAPNLPIIAQTAHAIQGDRDLFLTAGCDDYIEKPLNKNNLLAIISKYLEVK